MAINRGKQFESKVKEDLMKSLPDPSIDRIYDPQGLMYGISNPSDFIAYSFPFMFYIECKSHRGNTFPWTNLTQYEKLTAKIGIKGVRAGVILWMIEHDVVVYIPISAVKVMKEDGKKSFNVKMLTEDKYKDLIHVIPSIKKRVFMDSDYSILMNLKEGE